MPLHLPDAIYSLRHVPSWMLLTAAAGMVNVIAILATQQFVTHITGTATRFGMESATIWPALELGAVLLFFVIGAMFASWLLDVRSERGRRPLHAVPLFITASLIALVGIAGMLGVFGPFGGEVDRPADYGLLAVLCFAMGLQNGAVATSTGLVVRTTHLTGPATDLGLSLSQILFLDGEHRARAKRTAALRAGKIAAFIGGAALAVPLSRRLEFAAMFVPAAAIVVANVLSFVFIAPAREGRQLDARESGSRADVSL